MTVGYVPESQRDTSWWIWNKLFKCRIPYLQTMSPDYIRHFGVPVSGDDGRDKAIVSEQVVTMLTIAQMLEYYSKGVTIGVIRQEDTKLIYEYISNHLQAWKTELESSLNIRGAPVEDLVLMDKFAVAVYRHARHQFTTSFAEGLIAQRMRGGRSYSYRDMIEPPQPKRPEAVRQDEDPHSHLPERTSMADLFSSYRQKASK